MPNEAQLSVQRRACFPRVREGRLAALLAMTGIGAGPTIPSARETGARHVAWIENPPYKPHHSSVPLFQYSMHRPDRVGSRRFRPPQAEDRGAIVQNKANLQRAKLTLTAGQKGG